MIKRYVKTIQIEGWMADLTVKEYLKQVFLSKQLRGKLRQQRGIAVNGRLVSTAHVLAAGDVLALTLELEESGQGLYPANAKVPVQVVFENEDFLLVNKGAGQKMHPHSPTEDDTLLNGVQAYLEETGAKSLGKPAMAYMIHRLDRGTSGLVLIGKNPLVVPILNRQIKEKIAKKTYLAKVAGHFEERVGTFSKAIGQSKTNPRLQSLRAIDDGGLAALTHYQVLADDREKEESLVQLSLETGRMHQLRVHLSAAGHPIVGDDWYGGRPADRLYLQSTRLSLKMPWTMEERVFELERLW